MSNMLGGKWVCVDGGPHLLLLAEFLPLWEGHNQLSDGRIVETAYRVDEDLDRPGTDYDLACSHADRPLSLISAGCKQALVLGDIDTMSAWLPLEQQDGFDIMIPIQFGDFMEEMLIRSSKEIPQQALKDTGFIIEVGREGLVLVGACDFDDFTYGGLQRIPASGGIYRVWTVDYEPEPWELVRIHRLLKMECQLHAART